MSITRQKKVEQYMNFFRYNFGFHQPYQVLMDGTFCYAACQYRVKIREQLKSYLGNEVKILTTPCAVMETEKIGGVIRQTIVLLKLFGMHKCGHTEVPISVTECFLSMLGKKNENRYIIATQDHDLQAAARAVPGTPIIFLRKNMPLMEKPSEASEKAAAIDMETRFKGGDYQESRLKALKKAILGEPETVIKKKRRPKQPNPLSCLKKKQVKLAAVSSTENNKRSRNRRRVRVKIAKHVKEHLKQQKMENETN